LVRSAFGHRIAAADRVAVERETEPPGPPEDRSWILVARRRRARPRDRSWAIARADDADDAGPGARLLSRQSDGVELFIR
jgi:hypothetical protein